MAFAFLTAWSGVSSARRIMDKTKVRSCCILCAFALILVSDPAAFSCHFCSAFCILLTSVIAFGLPCNICCLLVNLPASICPILKSVVVNPVSNPTGVGHVLLSVHLSSLFKVAWLLMFGRYWIMDGHPPRRAAILIVLLLFCAIPHYKTSIPYN